MTNKKTKKVVSKTYKLWIQIEEHKVFSDGSEEYIDLKEDETRSVGRFKKVKDARRQMDFLGDTCMHDGDAE